VTAAFVFAALILPGALQRIARSRRIRAAAAPRAAA